jgi:hypothetical protein
MEMRKQSMQNEELTLPDWQYVKGNSKKILIKKFRQCDCFFQIYPNSMVILKMAHGPSLWAEPGISKSCQNG